MLAPPSRSSARPFSPRSPILLLLLGVHNLLLHTQYLNEPWYAILKEWDELAFHSEEISADGDTADLVVREIMGWGGGGVCVRGGLSVRAPRNLATQVGSSLNSSCLQKIRLIDRPELPTSRNSKRRTSDVTTAVQGTCAWIMAFRTLQASSEVWPYFLARMVR